MNTVYLIRVYSANTDFLQRELVHLREAMSLQRIKLASMKEDVKRKDVLIVSLKNSKSALDAEVKRLQESLRSAESQLIR